MNVLSHLRASAALGVVAILAAGCQSAAVSPSPSASTAPTSSLAAPTGAAPSTAPTLMPTPTAVVSPSVAPASAAPASVAPASFAPSPSAASTPRPGGSWAPAGTLVSQSWDSPTVALGDGGAISIDGRDMTAQRWDPTAGTWRSASGLNAVRSYFAAVTLRDGRGLVVGGVDTTDYEHWRSYSSAYVYDPATPKGTWTKVGLLGTARTAPAAAVLQDGRVLVAGGSYIDGPPWGAVGPTRGGTDAAGIVLAAARVAPPGPGTDGGGDFDIAPPVIGAALATAELFDPATGRWSPTDSMRFARAGAVAATLSDGRVLVVGPSSSATFGFESKMDPRAFGTAEVYDPATGRFTQVGSLPPIDRDAIAADGVQVPTEDPQATSMGTLVPLPDGDALLVGHVDSWKHQADVVRTFRFDGVTGTWSQVGPAWAWLNDWDAGTTHQTPGIDLSTAVAAPLASGFVLVAGGGGGEVGGGPTSVARLFGPATDGWLPLPDMPAGRQGGVAVALADGSVLLVGGDDPSAEKVTATRFVPSP